MYDEFDLLSLRASAGNGQENDPDDIAGLDGALRRVNAYKPPSEYADGPQRYATEPMINALTAFQEQNGLKTDGYANPGGPTERAINNGLLGKPRGTGLLFEPPRPLAGTVGNGFQNERRDIATVQRMLGALDYMPEDPYDRPPGFIDERTTAATRRFQRDKGLEPDGWMAPGGETETALRDSISDLARAKGRDWFAFAERAGKAQARMLDKLSYRSPPGAEPPPSNDEGDTDRGDPAVIPVMRDPWDSLQPGGRMPLGPSAPAYGIPAVPRAPAAPRTRPMPGIELLPGMSALAGALGLLEKPNEKDDGKAENIPPRTDDDAYRGADSTKPGVDPSHTRPGRNPDEPPLNLPDKTENIPPRRKRGDHILVLPDPSDWIGRMPIFVENRQGGPHLKEFNRDRGRPVIDIGNAVYGEGGIKQIGGPTPDQTQAYHEEFNEFRHKKQYGITSNAGASFEDLTYLIDYKGVRVKFVINTVTHGSDGEPIPRENRQRAKMVLNIRDHAFIVEVDKQRPGEVFEEKAWQGYLESRMRYIKRMIDRELITNKGPTQKLLDFFRLFGGK